MGLFVLKIEQNLKMLKTLLTILILYDIIKTSNSKGNDKCLINHTSIN